VLPAVTGQFTLRPERTEEVSVHRKISISNRIERLQADGRQYGNADLTELLDAYPDINMTRLTAAVG
jgi:hypothetical protein